jgi:hypothetical protein
MPARKPRNQLKKLRTRHKKKKKPNNLGQCGPTWARTINS